MATCGYAHIVLSGLLSNNGVIVTVLILLKFELFILSSAMTNTWVTLRPAVGRLDFFMFISLKMRFKSAVSTSYNENKPRLIDFINHKFFSIREPTPDCLQIVGRLSAD